MGYFELGRLIGVFETVFDNTKDVLLVLDRLVIPQLIEVNSRSTTTVIGATHARVTSAGWFYMRHLIHKFAYLDLALQDTPIDEGGVEDELRGSIYTVDNFGDKEDDKIERVKARFGRVGIFLDYLGRQEREERGRYDLGSVEGALGEKIVSHIVRAFESERDWIRMRLIENRQRFTEDAPEAADVDDGLFGAGAGGAGQDVEPVEGGSG